MTLPYDVSRCANADCPKRQTCARWLDPGRPGYQVFCLFKGGDDCPEYIPVGEPA